MDFYHMDEESRIRLICKWVVDIVLVVSFAWFIVYAFGTSVTVSGNSMQPVLKNGDVVLMNRLPTTSEVPTVWIWWCFPAAAARTT